MNDVKKGGLGEIGSKIGKLIWLMVGLAVMALIANSMQ